MCFMSLTLPLLGLRTSWLEALSAPGWRCMLRWLGRVQCRQVQGSALHTSQPAANKTGSAMQVHVGGQGRPSWRLQPKSSQACPPKYHLLHSSWQLCQFAT